MPKNTVDPNKTETTQRKTLRGAARLADFEKRIAQGRKKLDKQTNTAERKTEKKPKATLSNVMVKTTNTAIAVKPIKTEKLVKQNSINIDGNSIKALSIHPKYAAAIAVGEKKEEYRTWQTPYRGDLLICASQYNDGWEFPRGYALCVVNLYDIKWLPDDECYAWQLKDVRPIMPFKYKGTRKVIIKGKTPATKKIKYLNQFELHTLLINLKLTQKINWDWFILLVAKTGMRFSEALALTPKDFDFAHQSLTICKTWDYKGNGGFLPTKNRSSVRKIQIDWQTVIQFSELVKSLPNEKPIFIQKEKIYNSTVNDILERHCKLAKIPTISVHGLRHTHASLLLFAGVSIASVARRLGHASMTTTQKTYLHIIQELENQDVDLVMRSLSNLS